MKIFLTGAGGFLGSAVARQAASSDHQVLALHRPASSLSYAGENSRIYAVAGDLRQTGEWTEALQGADCVIHCAAAASGDLATQLAGTVLATENLLAALPKDLRRFVHISSFSVYDFDAPRMFGTLDEATAIESRPARRDAYTQTKLIQEKLVRDHCRAAGIALVVIRPGAIYGPGKDWDFGSSMKLGGFDLLFAPAARMRLIHVDDCARGIVAAVDAQVTGEAIVNLVGREQPSHWKFHRQARKSGASVGRAVPVPYAFVRALGGGAWLASKMFFKGKARLPELLDSPRQVARWRSLRYSSSHAKQALGWEEEVSIAQGLAEIVSKKK